MATQKAVRLWYQFSLRAFFFMITVIALAVATRHVWWAPRIEDLVNDFNEAVDEGRFDDASRLMKIACWHYPNSPTPKTMKTMVERGFEFNSANFAGDRFLSIHEKVIPK